MLPRRRIAAEGTIDTQQNRRAGGVGAPSASEVDDRETSILSPKDLQLLKKKIELLRFHGGKFHRYMAEFSVLLSVAPARAQDLAISALSNAILVFALLLNSVAGTAFLPLANENNFSSGFAFNAILSCIFVTAAAATVFLTYTVCVLATDSELGAWRQLLRADGLVEPWVWGTAVCQVLCIALGLLGGVYQADVVEHSADNMSRFVGLGAGGATTTLSASSTSASGPSSASAETNRFYGSYVPIGAVVALFVLNFVFFYSRSVTVAPLQMRHWAFWLAPFVLYLKPENERDCARLGPVYARKIVQLVDEHFGWRMFPYDEFFWGGGDGCFGVFGDLGCACGAGGGQNAGESGEKALDGHEPRVQRRKAAVDAESAAAWRDFLRRTGVFREEGGAAMDTPVHGHRDATTPGSEDSWCMKSHDFLQKHRLELIATILVSRHIKLALFQKSSMTVEFCYEIVNEALAGEAVTTCGQRLEMALALANETGHENTK
mmetsp:Transcript_4249/g.10341  ORF Transcript_4249/g.10341 Transcript_4249/m.10341 type:complete len:492 (+) Transcript_4249:108-1583(+)